MSWFVVRGCTFVISAEGAVHRGKSARSLGEAAASQLGAQRQRRVSSGPLRRIGPIISDMRPRSGENERGSVIDFALILILFSIVLVVIVVLLGPQLTEFLGSLVGK